MVEKNKKKTVKHKNNIPIAIVLLSFFESSEANAIMQNYRYDWTPVRRIEL